MTEETQRDEVREALPPLETVESITALDRIMEGARGIDISENILSLKEYYPETKMILTFKGVGFGISTPNIIEVWHRDKGDVSRES